MSNPFDLRKKTPVYAIQSQPSQPKARPNSQFQLQLQHEQPIMQQIPQDKIVGYNETPRDQWYSLPIGTHIRYVRNTGEFRSGGFIREKTINEDGEETIVLENDKVNRSSSKYRTFPIILSELSKIYSKIKVPKQKRQPVQSYQQPIMQQPQQSYQPQQQQQTKQYRDDPDDNMGAIASQAFRNIFQQKMDEMQQQLLHQQQQINSAQKAIADLVELISIRDAKNSKK